MSSTDDRIVKMQFDNAQFKKGAADTQKSLADLNKAVDSAGKSKGLLDLNTNMQRVSVTASKMAVATTAAIGAIAVKATNAALSLAKNLTFAPISQGFAEYESLLTKQNVIMNATGKSARVVKKTLNELNAYSDQTIYSFGNMTDAITKFTNAGIPLPKAVQSIKGIANAAAFAGASAEEANRAMYAFSQSMSLGFVGLQDWMQIENANMGTIAFKNELLKAGEAAGTLTKQGKGFVTSSGVFVSATKGWRDGLQEQWATTEVLNKALGKYADQNTKLGKKAFMAATQVRTFSAFMSTLKESLGSGWAQIFTSLFGNLNQATKMWTNLSSAVGGVIHSFFSWIGAALKTWRTMGGFEKTMEGFKNLLAPIAAILDVLGTAFREAFPNSGNGSGKALYAMSSGFAAITYPLQILADLIRLLTKPMTIFFQILKIGGETVGWVAGLLTDFVKAALGLVDLKAPDTGGLLEWIKALGDAIAGTLSQITDLLNKGKSIPEAFGSVSMPDLPSMPNLSMPNLGGGNGMEQASASILGLSIPLGGLKKVLDFVKDAFGDLAKGAEDAGGFMALVGNKMAEAFVNVVQVLDDILERLDMQDVVGAFNMALLATFIISVTRMFNSLSKAMKGWVGIGPSISGALDGIGGALNSFQTAAKAKLIIAIAVAIALLAGSLWLLSRIPWKNLTLRLAMLGAVMWMFGKVMEKMETMVKAMNQKGMTGKLLALSVAVIAMATAMAILAGALVLFKYVEWESIKKGGVAFIAMTGAMLALGKVVQSKSGAAALITAGVGMIAMAQALMILAVALKAFEYVEWDSMKKAGASLAAVAAVLLVIGALMKSKYGAAAMIAGGAAMILVSNSMVVLAGALLLFNKVKWESMKKAGAALVGLAVALLLMIPGAAVGIFLPAIGAGLIALAFGLKAMELVEWKQIPKMIVAFAGLGVALILLAPALYLIAPALILVGIGLMVIAGAFLIFAVAMTAAMLVMTAGSAALAAFAVAGAMAFVGFLQTLAAEAPLIKRYILEILQSIIDTIVEAVPMVIQGIKDLFSAVMAEFSSPSHGKKTGEAGEKATMSFADGIQAKIPAIVKRASDMLITFLKALRSKAGDIAAAGVDLIVSVLDGINSKIGDLVDAGYRILLSLAEGISSNLLTLINRGVQLIADFLHGLADAIRGGSGLIGDGIADVVNAFWDVGVNLMKGMSGGILSMAGKLGQSVLDVVNPLPEIANKALEIFSPSRVFMRIGRFLVLGLTKGIQNNAAAAITSVASMVGGQIAIANEYISGFIQKLDQQAMAARAKAEGLAAAAEKAQRAADKTKSKKDDKAADRLENQAEKADKKADAAEAKAEKAKEQQDRKEQFKNASYLEKAQMRSEDAQDELDAAKAAEARAAKALIQADALDKQAKAEGVTPKQRKEMQEEADRLREQAKRDAKLANKNLQDAKNSAKDALKYQKLAGAEAAAAFQEAFDADAKQAADDAAFDKMSDAEKAELRRKQAEELQKKAAEDLKKAQKLAYTDIDAANDLAALALAEADRAREYFAEAERLSATTVTGGGPLGTVVNLDTSEAAAIAMREHENLYSSAAAAAAGDRTIEFNQYNTSPEAISPTEVYRQTNNLFAHAVTQLEEAAA